MYRTFGEFVRFRRHRLGLTQRQVAAGLGLKSAAFLSDIEAGNRYPSPSLFPALARLLETDIRDLRAFDTRASLAEVRRLLEDHPESAVSFSRIVAAVRASGADEILRRLHAYVEPPPESPGKRPRKPSVRKKAPPAAHDTLPL